MEERTNNILEFYEKLYPNQLQDIFVSEHLDKEGNRKYESFFIFNNKIVFEAKDFLNEDDFDAASYLKKIVYYRIKKKEYDFNEAKNKSRMSLYFRLSEEIFCELKASGNNCDYLRTVFFDQILPNVKVD